MKLKDRLSFFICTLFLSSSTLLYAPILLDLSTFSFPKLQEKGWRLLVINLNPQKVQEVHYIYDTPHTTFEHAFLRWSSLKGWVLHKPLPKDVYLTAEMPIQDHPKEKRACLQKSSHHFLLPLQPNLSKPVCKQHKVCLYRWDEKGKTRLHFDALHPSRLFHTQERGFLGERVTSLLFRASGFVSFPTQNKSNQGFDGFFIHPQKHILCLTESKFRREGKTAIKYLENDLGEQAVARKLKQLTHRGTKRFALRTIQNPEWRIIKVVHRLHPDGQISIAAAPLDRFLLFLFTYPHLQDAPFAIKYFLLKEMIKRFWGSQKPSLQKALHHVH